MRFGLLFAIAVVGLVLQAPVPAAALTPEISDVEWRVVEIDGMPVADAGTLVFFRNQIGGRAACNRLFGQFASTPSQGRAFSGIATTRKHCEGKMQLEQSLLKALERMQNFKLDGGALTLVDGDGKPLVKLQR